MKTPEKLLVLCVDRDNDLGKKVNIEGPIIGKDECLKAAAKLAVYDPTDSDSNAIFGAVKKYNEIKQQMTAEIAVLTGYGKTGFESDRKITTQFESVLEKFDATGVVFVTDGAEDDQVIPLITSRLPLVSKETIIVKQASEVESTYYTIKQALKDPDFARTFILVPGTIVLMWGILAFVNAEKLFFQSMLIVVGSYLILKGTGLEERIAGTIGTVTKSISLQRVSFPFYLMTILLIFIGAWSGYIELTTNGALTVQKASEVAGQIILFIAFSAISFLIGKSVDAIQLRKAYQIRNYFLTGAAVFILWFIIDAGKQVIVGEPYADLGWFATNVFIGFLFGLVTYRISQLLDLRKKITKLLIGLPVYSKDGKWIGEVETIERKKSLEFKNRKTNKTRKIESGEFFLSEGRIILTKS